MIPAQGKEFFISRKVLGLPLEVRRESFVGVGQFQTFSQTKTQSQTAEAVYPKAKKSLLERVRSLSSNKTDKKRLLWRMSLHTGLLVGALSLVIVGKVSSQANLSALGNGAGEGSGQTSEIATGALLAGDSQGVVAEAVSQKAQSLGNQVALATAADDFLAKKAQVVTANSPRDITSYTVKDGDTLSTLSQKFSLTTDTIKWANGITDENSIKPGDQLTILPVNGVLVTAAGGDDIGALANKYQASAGLIDSFNSLEGKAPTAGEKIVIPDGVIPTATAPAPTAAVAAAPVQSFSNTFALPGSGGGGSLANSYSYGYCTWYVASRRAVPNGWGNAINWYYAARASGWATGSEPRPGAIAWERMNHVAYVESVGNDGTVTVSEMNFNGGWGRRSYRTTSASHFLYIY